MQKFGQADNIYLTIHLCIVVHVGKEIAYGRLSWILPKIARRLLRACIEGFYLLEVGRLAKYLLNQDHWFFATLLYKRYIWVFCHAIFYRDCMWGNSEWFYRRHKKAHRSGPKTETEETNPFCASLFFVRFYRASS